MNNLQIFNNAQFGEIRTIDENGTVLFCGSDIAKALGYSNTKDALARHCKEDGVVFHDLIDNMGREQHAKFINEGNTKLFYGPDFVFVSGDSQEDTAEKITERYCLEIQESGIENVQILSPFRSEGAASSEQLNETIRELVNPFRSAEEEIKFGPRIFRVNDRIMQTKNTEKVSNGDLGFIRYIKDTDQGKKIGMDFGAGRTLEYGVDDLSNVDLAYATTIHKAMGSEYETVIMPLLKAHTIMMYRNLLYTGITRAKKRVVLIGQKQVLFMAIHRNEIGKRNTLLGMRIQMYFKAYAKKAGIPIPAALEEQLKNAS